MKTKMWERIKIFFNDYFLILIWSIKKPPEEKLVPTKRPSQKALVSKYKNLFTKNKSRNKISSELLENFIKDRLVAEEDRRKTIETKAHSVLGQTGVTSTLLLVLFSLTPSISHLSFSIRIVIYVILIFVLMHFICSALHAGHVVDPNLSEPDITIETFNNKGITKNDVLLEKYYIIEHLEFINDIRATFLTCALKCLRISFVLILVGSIIIAFLLSLNP